MENNKIKNLEKRMTRVEKKLKLTEIKPSTKVICHNCKHPINTRSELQLISCPSCGAKTKNTSLKEKEKEETFNAFEGKRYENYDFRDMKESHFGKNRFSKCCQCGKKVDFENSYYGFNDLRCKKCYKAISESNNEAVGKMVKGL